ncbi:hypothetical protein LK09_16640 [Microbacterium mangrovi]|uniref:Uncharacterized protein n=1 Tax=Microbacterium mangrovi TaxID=1348253 RepID=A0A0B2A2F2_9MICO|nr:DUF6186 family protein [Microbacterium mangrovi]KHK95994.1 hypothetical protein LK09_16640 [Microbacterium mangrovi]
MISILYFGGCALALIGASAIVRHDHPEATVTALFDILMADRVIRLAILACWWWLGWHFLAGQTI